MIRFASVASGIETPSVAWGPLGWKAVFFAEIDKFPSTMLAHHYPDTPNLGDFSSSDFLDEALRLHRKTPIDVLIGGTPCQDFSVAGKRASMGGVRGNLTLEYIRIIHEINPEWAIWENVPGVINTRDNAFGQILGALVGAGCPLLPDERWTNSGVVIGPKRKAAWRVLDAQGFDPQRRKRVFIVSSRTVDRHDPGRVLFETETEADTGLGNRASGRSLFSQPKSLCRDIAPSGKTEEEVAGTITQSTGATGATIDEACSGLLIIAKEQIFCGTQNDACRDVNIDLAPTLRSGNSGGAVNQIIAFGSVEEDLENGSHWDGHQYPHPTLNQSHNTGGIGASNQELFSQRGAGLVADTTNTITESYGEQTGNDFNSENLIGIIEGDSAASTPDLPRLRSGCGRGGETAVVYTVHGTQDPCVSNSTSFALGRNHGQENAIFAFGGGNSQPIDVSTACNAHGGASGRMDFGSETFAMHPTHLGMVVRRLTPEECEQLQGLPPGYTKIPWRGKPAAECPDGHRYKAIGNAMNAKVIRWIGDRINLTMDKQNYYRGF